MELTVSGDGEMINVTIWNENIHEQRQPEVREIYPRGIHGCIADFLEKNRDLYIRTATFDDPEHGLSQEVLDSTDVLIYWSHTAQEEFSQVIAERVRQAVLRGMGLIALHSAHYSKVMKMLLGTSMTLRWRHGDRERLFVTAPSHPIARNVPDYFELPMEEMYGEYFDIPKPDDVVFTGWFAGGEVFRSGCTFQRGLGKIFYFQPGHEMYPTYYDKNIRQIITNAVYWCDPVRKMQGNPDCTEVKEPLEKPAAGAAEGSGGEAETRNCGEVETQSGGKAKTGNSGEAETRDGGKIAETHRRETGGGEIKLSVFYEHLREAAQQTGKSMEELYRETGNAGIKGIEMDYAVLAAQPELNREIRGAGLEISNLYHFFEFGKKYGAGMHIGRKMIDTAEKMGIRRVMLIPGFLEPEEALMLHRAAGSYEEMARFMEQSREILFMRDAAAELTEYAAERGITVSMEDFDSFTSPLARIYSVKWFLEQVPGLKHTLDMGNYVFCDEDVREAYELLKDTVVHVHCKDRGQEQEDAAEIRRNLGLPGDAELRVRRGLKSVPTGEGYLPIAELVGKLRAGNYRGYLAIEHFGAQDQLDFMKRSAEFLRNLLE